MSNHSKLILMEKDSFKLLLIRKKEGYRLNIDNQNYYLVKTNEFDWANYEDSNFEQIIFQTQF